MYTHLPIHLISQFSENSSSRQTSPIYSLMILLLLLLPLASLSSPLLPHYLSLLGSDSYDGTSPEPVPGTQHGPWASLPHAISAIRHLNSLFLNLLLAVTS